MNAIPPDERDSIAMVEVIQFKWLMGVEGTQIHVERLLEEPVYAEVCLGQAESSEQPALVSAAQQLRDALRRRHEDPA